MQCNTDSCGKRITCGANVYLYWCVSLLAHMCAVCVCMSVISNQSTTKKPYRVRPQ